MTPIGALEEQYNNEVEKRPYNLFPKGEERLENIKWRKRALEWTKKNDPKLAESALKWTGGVEYFNATK